LKVVAKYFCLLIPMLASILGTEANAQVTSITLGAEQIGTVKTAASITTKISFPEKVSSVICGDLYDATSGKGTFVIQQSDNDVFIKPIAQKGQSNMFVKTNDGKKTYNFDLLVVPFNQAHRVINVLDPKSGLPSPENPPMTNGNSPEKPALTEADLEKRKADIEQAAQTKADDILRKARQDAMRITNEAEARAAEIDRQSSGRVPQEAERRFVQAMLGGIQRADLKATRVEVKKVVISLDPSMYTFEGKTHLRYMIQNTGDKDFTFTAITLEAGALKTTQPIPVELSQSKSENSLAPTENLSGVITFDAKLVAGKDRLVLYLRGDDNAEIARLVIQ
jgi:cell division septum initiation protein DivIVA